MRNHISKTAFMTGLLLIAIILCEPMVAAEEKIMGKTVNINTATAEELAQIPLITPELAQAIVAYREEVGDFQFIEELLLLDGFDRELFRKVQPFFILEGVGGDDCTC
jgi:competence ComEA-like helix-hairpin-helix protein